MGRPRASSIDVKTPERILTAAEAAFAAAGLERATLSDIAARAGVTRPALLYHFAAKENLYEAAVGRAFSALGDILRSAMSQGETFRERLHAVVDAFLTYVEVHPALARIVVRELVADSGPGRGILLHFGVPLVDEVVTFLEREGRGCLRRGVPVRAALMALVSDVFLRAAAGSLREPLWGRGEHAWDVTEALLLPFCEVSP